MQPFTALVLAGDRRPDDPLLQHSGRPCKALIDFSGRPMVLHVLDALAGSQYVGEVIMAGPGEEHWRSVPELSQRIASRMPCWLAAENSPSSTTHSVLSKTPAGKPVLVTTADHPLLRAPLVDEFCARSLQAGADVVVGLAPYEQVRKAFPALKKTVLRFRNGQFCGCNLFAFLTDRGRIVADRWREVEAERKNPRKLVSMLGLWSVLRYRFGWLSLEGALNSLSRSLGVKVAAVVLPHAEAAVDVDSVADHGILEEYARAG